MINIYNINIKVNRLIKINFKKIIQKVLLIIRVKIHLIKPKVYIKNFNKIKIRFKRIIILINF